MSEDDTSQFDPYECASLHNQLVQRVKEPNPSIRPQQDVLRAHSADTPLRARLPPDVQTFLAAIESWLVEGESTGPNAILPAPQLPVLVPIPLMASILRIRRRLHSSLPRRVSHHGK